MLTITYNNHDIPVDEGFSMRFSWVNPACYFDKIPGAVGLGIEIPVNDYSQAIFGSPNRFEKYSSGSDRKFSGVYVRYDGVLLMTGTLNITSANQETYSGWLQSLVGVVGEEQRERKINELQLSSENEPWGNYRMQYFENKDTYDPDSDDFCTGEHYNRRFWEEIGRTVMDAEEYFDDNGVRQSRQVEISRLMKLHRDNFNFLVNKSHPDGGVIASGEGCVVSAFLFLHFLLKEVFKRCQFFIDPDNDAFTDELDDYRSLAVYNNYNLMEPTIITEEKENWEQDEITGDWGLSGYQEIKNLVWQLGNQESIDYVHLVPGINIGEFLLGLQNMLNIIFFFKDDRRVAIVDRLGILSMTPFDLSSYLTENWIIGDRKNTTLKFIVEYDKNDAIISDSFHDLTDRRNDFGDPVRYLEDLEDLTPEFGEIRHVIETDEWYEYKWDVSVNNDGESTPAEFDRIGWVRASTGPQPVLYGTGDEIEEIKTNVYTPYTHWNELTLAKLQNGIILPTRHLWNSFSPCVFFYLGQNSISNKNVSVTKSLQWVDRQALNEIGLFQNRWKSWASFWSNRLPVEADFNLPLNVLYYVINNITNKFKTQEGEFIIEEMEVEFGLHVIGKTHIKGYKV